MEDHALVYLFESNQLLEEKLSEKSLPTRIDTFVELDGGFQAPVKLLLPPHMDENGKYPLLVYAYGGPGSQVKYRCLNSPTYVHQSLRWSPTAGLLDGASTLLQAKTSFMPVLMEEEPVFKVMNIFSR